MFSPTSPTLVDPPYFRVRTRPRARRGEHHVRRLQREAGPVVPALAVSWEWGSDPTATARAIESDRHNPLVRVINRIEGFVPKPWTKLRGDSRTVVSSGSPTRRSSSKAVRSAVGNRRLDRWHPRSVIGFAYTDSIGTIGLYKSSTGLRSPRMRRPATGRDRSNWLQYIRSGDSPRPLALFIKIVEIGRQQARNSFAQVLVQGRRRDSHRLGELFGSDRAWPVVVAGGVGRFEGRALFLS